MTSKIPSIDHMAEAPLLPNNSNGAIYARIELNA